MLEMSVDTGRNSCNHFLQKQKTLLYCLVLQTWPGLGRGSRHRHPLSPASPSLSSCKPLPGVYRGPQHPGLEGLSSRRADVPVRLPANIVRAAAHVQTQGAADEAANSRHRAGVPKGEPRGRGGAFPLSPPCPSLHTDVPAVSLNRRSHLRPQAHSFLTFLTVAHTAFSPSWLFLKTLCDPTLRPLLSDYITCFLHTSFPFL